MFFCCCCCGKHSRVWPAHLGKSKWRFQHRFYPAAPKSEDGREKCGQPEKNVSSRMCVFLGATEHCRSFLVSGHDFLLPFHSLIFFLLLLWEGWPFSCVSGAPSLPSFLRNALCHSLPSLTDLQGLFKPPFSFPLLPWMVSACLWYFQLRSLPLLCKEC